jgi:hypothetical protein
MARVAPSTGKADVTGVVDAVVSVFGSVRRPFSMLLHSPERAAARRNGLEDEVIDVLRAKGDRADTLLH